MRLYFVTISALFYVFSGCSQSQESGFEEGSVSDYCYQEISKFKKEHKVKGLAFALFDAEGGITEFCLGKSTHGFPIDKQTLFSIQSISKSITAMAALIAEQDSLLDLDTPVSEYLPGFTVNSCFEEHPEDLITMRHMLSHRAGFTHEAPVGNNFDHRHVDIEEHINSISLTWLKFPVGSRYSYSNLGYDLSTRILSRQSGMSFNSYLKEKIFLPLGMTATTVDDLEVVANNNRTEGTTRFLKSVHVMIPLIGSGAVYTNLEEFVKYAQLYLNEGSWKEQQIIKREKLKEMYTIERDSYGLGIHVGMNNGDYYIDHGGGGYGYTSHMLMYPEYGIGAVLLCNGASNTFAICQQILREYISRGELAKSEVVKQVFDEINGDYFSNPDRYNNISGVDWKGEEIFQDEWEKYTGTYFPTFPGYSPTWIARLGMGLGYKPVKFIVSRNGNRLELHGGHGDPMLTEVSEGLFITRNGEMLDLREDPPTFRNILLVKK